MLIQELKRIVKDVRICIFFLAIIPVLFVLAVISAQNDDISPSGYKEFNKEYSNISDEEKNGYALEQKEKYDIILNPEAESFNKDEYELFSFIIHELRAVLNYNENRENRIKQIRSRYLITGASPLLEKQERDYDSVGEMELKYNGSLGIYKAINFTGFYFIIFLLSVFVITRIFLYDTENGTDILFSTMKNGRLKAFVSRCISGMIAVFMCVITCFIAECIGFVYKYGMPGKGFLMAPVQSLANCDSLVYKHNNMILLAIFVLGTTLISFMFGMIAVLIFYRKRHIVIKGILVFVLAALELILYVKIDDRSWLAGLKEYNVFSFLFWGKSLYSYSNIRFFGYYFSKATLLLLMIFILLILSTMICGMMASGGVKLYLAKGRKNRKANFDRNNSSMPFKEVRKLLFESKGIVVFIIITVMTVILAGNQKIHYESISEYYYRNYANEFSGFLTDEKKIRVDELYNTLNQEMEKLTLLGLSNGNNKYDDCRYRLDAVMMLRNDIDYIENGNAEYIIYQPAYKLLFDNFKMEFILLILLSLGITAFIVPYYMKDKISGMEDFSKSTALGEKGFARLKGINAFLFVALFTLILSGLFSYSLIRRFKIDRLGIPAKNFQPFSKIPIFLNLRMVLLGFAFLRLLWSVLILFACRKMCRRADGIISAVSGSIMIWMPILILLYVVIR